MRTDIAQPVRLADYRAPDFLIDKVDLDVRLAGAQTQVEARLTIRRNPVGRADAPLVLDGDELNVISVALDGEPLTLGNIAQPERLTLENVPDAFTLTTVTQLDPAANTKLMGLYRSGSAYCTQCEAEGFRRITYFLDRPDVLSVYTTRIEADCTEAPILLGNGNCRETGVMAGGTRHYAIWDDPWPKPSYLFALVGGDLALVEDIFLTQSQRKVKLGIYVEHGKEARAGYAMDALKRSMAWDEQAFGREYDLDVFNIVAVSDFNMGAMENKGLNIFNDKYVLASSDTATDSDYGGIETVIAHEYFHNWTGNRITCRDWFQLCLKEGLTVFRDQEFTADERSRPVKRIVDVRNLRATQFAEDSGPLAHPVRPTAYREINNFYTATIYEKGAELIRMLKILLGDDLFRKGMDLYLQSCDGTAATVEEFISCFGDVSGRDLTHFFQWYVQAGTPVIEMRRHWDETHQRLTIHFKQTMAPTPSQPDKSPLQIPIAYGLVMPDGSNGHEGVFVLDQAEGQLVLEGLPQQPVPSVLRGFSAPVRLETDLTSTDLLTLFRHDNDPFNRWQAAQSLAMSLLVDAVSTIRRAEAPHFDPAYAQTLAHLLNDNDDHAFVAQVFSMPSENDIAREIKSDIDPDAIYLARKGLRQAIGLGIGDDLRRAHQKLSTGGSYSPDAKSAGQRALRNTVLDLIVVGDPDAGLPLSHQCYQQADNMTDRIGALAVLAQYPGETRETALSHFAERFAHEALALDKWFALQACLAEDGTLDRVKALMAHPGFSMTNPNRVRSLIGAFCMSNPTQFNRVDGAGYHFLADIVLTLDKTNPQVAARMLSAFRTWRSYESTRRTQAGEVLRRISDASSLSADVADIVVRSLA